MGLQKQFDLPTGFNANYWKVTQVNFDVETETPQVLVSLYKNQAQSGSVKPVYALSFDFNNGDFPFTAPAMDIKSPLALAYEKILAMPKVNGNQDNFLFDAASV